MQRWKPNSSVISFYDKGCLHQSHKGVNAGTVLINWLLVWLWSFVFSPSLPLLITDIYNLSARLTGIGLAVIYCFAIGPRLTLRIVKLSRRSSVIFTFTQGHTAHNTGRFKSKTSVHISDFSFQRTSILKLNLKISKGRFSEQCWQNYSRYFQATLSNIYIQTWLSSFMSNSYYEGINFYASLFSCIKIQFNFLFLERTSEHVWVDPHVRQAHIWNAMVWSGGEKERWKFLSVSLSVNSPYENNQVHVKDTDSAHMLLVVFM